jgi:hypothetical protein
VPQPPPPVPGNLVVKVINDEDNSNVNGVDVNITGPQSGTAKSAGAGEAKFNGIPTGSYSISHSTACYTSASASATVNAAQTTPAELHVKHIHAVITIDQLTYSGNTVVNKDTIADFPKPEWQNGRAEQSPVSYARNTKVVFDAVFKVTTAPCRPEKVDVKGAATFGSVSLEWVGNVTVSPGDSQATLTLTSNNPLANEVGIFEVSDISWQMNPGGTGWASAGTTRNVMYVTLGAASGTPNYWTLLDISCRAAAGETSESGLITKVFTGFTGRAIKRKRDGNDLTYWNPRSTCTATNTQLLLASANGAGQCGSWAECLIDTYKVHGVTSGEKILIVHTVSDWTGSQVSFMVKNWIINHPPASIKDDYTHNIPLECKPGVNHPGQNNPTPPEAFYNHFIVRAIGKFWDPSYGTGPYNDQVAWEADSIDGLIRNPQPRAGFDKSLNPTTKLLEFYLTSGMTKI